MPAGIVATVATYPLMTVRTCLQPQCAVSWCPSVWWERGAPPFPRHSTLSNNVHCAQINTLQATRKTAEAAAEQQEQQDVEGGGQQHKRKPQRRGALHEMAEVSPRMCVPMHVCFRVVPAPGPAGDSGFPSVLSVLSTPPVLPPCLPALPTPAALPLHLPQLVREGGWQALFSGLEASLLGTTVSQGIYFYL